MIHTCTLWPHRIISIVNEQHTFPEKISFPAASEFDNNLVLTFWRSSIYRSRYTYSRNYILRHVHGTEFVFFFFIWLGVLLIGAVINHGKLVLQTLHFYHASRNHSYSLLSRISASVEMFSHSLRICIGNREKKRNKIGERIRKGNDYDKVRWSNPEYNVPSTYQKFYQVSGISLRDRFHVRSTFKVQPAWFNWTSIASCTSSFNKTCQVNS